MKISGTSVLRPALAWKKLLAFKASLMVTAESVTRENNANEAAAISRKVSDVFTGVRKMDFHDAVFLIGTTRSFLGF